MFDKKNRKKSSKNKNNSGSKNIGTQNSKKRNGTPQKRQYVNRRSEVYGIIIITLSILVFLSFFNFGRPGIVTGYLNNFFTYIFGITKYLFAILLLTWGISFFIKRIRNLPSSFGWGFILIYIAASGLVSNNFKYTDVFDPIIVKTRGGILGAGVFYGLFRLVGSLGAIIILVVLIIIGLLIVTRLSIIGVGKKIRDRTDEDRKIKNGRVPGTAAVSRPPLKELTLKDNTISVDPRKRLQNGIELNGKNDIGPKNDGRMPKIISFDEKQKNRGVYNGEKALKSDSGQLKIPITDDRDIDANYRLPPVSILKKSDSLSPKLYKQSAAENVKTLNKLFYYFNLPAKIASVTRGPSITLYEVTLSQGVKVSKLLSLEDDFCVALGSPDLRFLTPIPGKSAIGIEVPNKIRSLVTLGDIFSRNDKTLMDDLLTVPLGKNFSGEVVNMTINNMPHILIAGATNSGKSVCLNTIITSLLMKIKPGQVKLIMIDPKMVELSIYNGIPHLLAPVIVDPRKAASVLSWALEEMKNRFQLLLDYNCKTLEEYNFMVKKDSNKDPELKQLPYILIIIDELADLMMVAASEVEDSICRIAQMARAVGIHLIISTQKPVVKILTGLIKTNIPARIAFRVTDNTDSRVILEHSGAEKLIGKGDMLYLSPQGNRPERLQCAFVTSKEIGLITSYIKNQMKTEYLPEITDRITRREERIVDEDELLIDALQVIIDAGHASASLLQRRLRLGYARAARIIDQLEERDYIGGYDGSKPRDVLISREEFEDILQGKSK